VINLYKQREVQWLSSSKISHSVGGMSYTIKYILCLG